MTEAAGIACAEAEGGRVLALRVLALRVLEQVTMDATSTPILRSYARCHFRSLNDEQREAMALVRDKTTRA